MDLLLRLVAAVQPVEVENVLLPLRPPFRTRYLSHINKTFLMPCQKSRMGARSYAHTEEFDFFDRVKRFLGSKTTYIEFLKILNLFNQDILTPKMLIDKVEPFLYRAPELMQWLKNYLKVEEELGEGMAFLKVVVVDICRAYPCWSAHARADECQAIRIQLSHAAT